MNAARNFDESGCCSRSTRTKRSRPTGKKVQSENESATRRLAVSMGQCSSGFREAWIPPNPIACCFMDDGTEHDSGRIHYRRVPYPADASVIDLKEIVVLHFQYVAWERMASKH